MALTIDEVDKIAKLSRLSFTDAEKQKMQTQLTDILNYVDQIQGLADQVEIKLDEDPSALNIMRDDVAVEAADPTKFLAQAPAREGDYLKVKSILE